MTVSLRLLFLVYVLAAGGVARGQTAMCRVPEHYLNVEIHRGVDPLLLNSDDVRQILEGVNNVFREGCKNGGQLQAGFACGSSTGCGCLRKVKVKSVGTAGWSIKSILGDAKWKDVETLEKGGKYTTEMIRALFALGNARAARTANSATIFVVPQILASGDSTKPKSEVPLGIATIGGTSTVGHTAILSFANSLPPVERQSTATGTSEEMSEKRNSWMAAQVSLWAHEIGHLLGLRDQLIRYKCQDSTIIESDILVSSALMGGRFHADARNILVPECDIMKGRDGCKYAEFLQALTKTREATLPQGCIVVR